MEIKKTDNSNECSLDPPGTSKEESTGMPCHGGVSCSRDCGCLIEACRQCACRTCIYGKCPPSTITWSK